VGRSRRKLPEGKGILLIFSFEGGGKIKGCTKYMKKKQSIRELDDATGGERRALKARQDCHTGTPGKGERIFYHSLVDLRVVSGRISRVKLERCICKKRAGITLVVEERRGSSRLETCLWNQHLQNFEK